MIADGMKNGEILRGPPSRYAVLLFDGGEAAMPEPMKTPIRGASAASMVNFESSIAYCEAATAN
jgi:hypothetical protein